MAARIWRWRWALLVAALLALGLGYAFWPTGGQVDLRKVTRGPMAVSVTDDGVTRAEEFYVVSAPVTGNLARIELEPGDRVAKGQVISRMTGRASAPLDQRSRRELTAALASAQAAINAASAQLAQDRRDLARAEELSRRGFLPRAQLEAARLRVSTAQAAQAQSRAESARIRALLSQPPESLAAEAVAVRAPASGEVLSVLRESQGTIAEGTELMTIGNPDAIEVVVDLISREAVRVRPGDRVLITQWGGPDPIVGRVERVEPYGRLKVSALGIEEQRVNVIAGFDGAAAGKAVRLGHGYQVDATIILWQTDKALRLPISALFRGQDGGWRVFVAERKRARERQVRLGQINDEYAEVLGGIEAGEYVVTNPSASLREGAKLKARN
jgi:HlyD family secretion protein